jgi:hypothetical protein
MRKLLPFAGIFLALFCAWLVFSQPTPDALNAGGGERVHQESAVAPAPELDLDALASAEGKAAHASIAEQGEPEAQREAVVASSDGKAEITVQVMLADSSQPLASIEVRAQRIGGILSTFGDAVEPIESARTGQGGVAVLRVPAGVALMISAGGPGKVSVLVSREGATTKLEYEEATHQVEALRAGEKIKIELLLSESSDLHWFQLVDGQSGGLLPGARVHEPHSAQQAADDNALVSVAESDEFFGRPVVIFGMPGYGPRRVYLEEGGDSAERALRVELFASASVRLTVLQNGIPLVGARVAMHYAKSDGEVELPNRARWGGKPRMAPFWGDTDAQGVLLLQGLPSHQPLSYGISSSFGTEIDQPAPGPLILQAGEQREISWEIGNQQDLLGRVIDVDGSPVANVEVWLLSASFQHGIEGEQAHVPSGADHYRLAGVATDDSGEFAFEQIHPGQYWLALAPTDDSEMVAIARRVIVPPLQAPPFVELQFSSGAMVRGKCVDLTGKAVADVDLFAIGTVGRENFSARSDADGSFELGPFSAGSQVQFYVFPNSDGYQLAGPASALAGDGRELILRMAKGGSIRGRVVNDVDGKPIQIGVTISSREAGGSSGTSSGPQGQFEWSGLAPGTWRVIAKNSSGWLGMSEPIILTASESVEDVEVRVAPSGTLVIESDGAASGTVRLSFDGWAVDFVSVGPGERKSVTVPFGVIQIARLNGDPQPPFIGAVTVGAGKVETFTLKSKQ